MTRAYHYHKDLFITTKHNIVLLQRVADVFQYLRRVIQCVVSPASFEGDGTCVVGCAVSSLSPASFEGDGTCVVGCAVSSLSPASFEGDGTCVVGCAVSSVSMVTLTWLLTSF